jgi:hypothetical protein
MVVWGEYEPVIKGRFWGGQRHRRELMYAVIGYLEGV